MVSLIPKFLSPLSCLDVNVWYIHAIHDSHCQLIINDIEYVLQRKGIKLRLDCH